MLDRGEALGRVRALLRRFPIVAVVGPRQVGKSTLARTLLAGRDRRHSCFDLEDPVDLGRLDDAGLALRPLRGLVVLDEIQRRPDLFPLLRVLADRPRTPARFLVLGSASPGLLRQSSESLAGRIAYFELDGFNLGEVGTERLDPLWERGGFPRAFTARSTADSFTWRENFVRTFLERDAPALGVNVPERTLHRFWMMLAHWHGQVWNASEFGRSLGVAHTTARHYLDQLSSLFVVRQLAPWFENIAKRQVRSPKVYVSDSGLAHALLGIRSRSELERHPKLGASWEGFLLGQVVQRLRVAWRDCYFWGTHGGAELDLFVDAGAGRFGFEFKRAEAPKLSASMHTALADLRLTRLDVVHAGPETYALAPDVRAVAATRIWEDIAPLR